MLLILPDCVCPFLVCSSLCDSFLNLAANTTLQQTQQEKKEEEGKEEEDEEEEEEEKKEQKEQKEQKEEETKKHMRTIRGHAVARAMEWNGRCTAACVPLTVGATVNSRKRGRKMTV